MLRFREFQAVRGTDCLPKQGCLRGVVPPSVSIFFSSYSGLTAAQRACQTAEIWRRPELARLAPVSCAASLCSVAGATKVTPCLVQGVNIAFLVQGYGHAAAKPDGNSGRSPSM
ncbi:hypothetical protein [Escherichia coli]|uniref:hypothetical protein n=1 Tax=Escherichia coli TaxID=562 RepID=UPI003B5C590B